MSERMRRVPGRVGVTGLVIAAVGFVGAGVVPGPGPRVVPSRLEIGVVYLPPVLAGLAVLGFAAWSWWTTTPRAVPVAGCLALVLLAGSATLGRDAILFRLTHPWDLAPFLSDTCQLLGELVTVTAAIAHCASTRR